jgi:hypothetical protein
MVEGCEDLASKTCIRANGLIERCNGLSRDWGRDWAPSIGGLQ